MHVCVVTRAGLSVPRPMLSRCEKAINAQAHHLCQEDFDRTNEQRGNALFPHENQHQGRTVGADADAQHIVCHLQRPRVPHRQPPRRRAHGAPTCCLGIPRHQLPLPELQLVVRRPADKACGHTSLKLSQRCYGGSRVVLVEGVVLNALSNGGRPAARGWRLKLPAGRGTRAKEPLWGRVSEEAPELSGSAARDQTGPPCAGTDSVRAAAPMLIMSSVPSCSNGI